MRQSAPLLSTVSAVAALAVALTMGSAGAAGADWLVTKDGARVETKGPWRVEGKRVLFTTQATGTLSSLRLADVDVPASERATAEAKAAAESAAAAKAQPEAPKKPVKSFTDKDFGHSEPVVEGEAAGEGAPGEGAAAQAPVSTTVEVANWTPEPRPDSKQLVIRGTIRNNGEDVATAVAVSARLIDQQGLLIATQDAQLATRALRPGQTTSFDVTFTDVVTYGSVAFEVRSVPLLTRPKPEAEED